MNQEQLIYQSILKYMSDGVMTIGLDGRIITVNEAGGRILNIKAEECIGRSYGEIFFLMQENDDFNQLVLDAVYESTVTHNRTVAFHTASGVRTLQVSTSFINSDQEAGQKTAVIVVMNDISELERTHQAERALTEELKQKHKELGDSYLQLEDANARMTALLKKVQTIRIAATAFIIVLFFGIGVFVWLRTGVHDGDIVPDPRQSARNMAAQNVYTVASRPLSDSIALKSKAEPIRVVNVTCPFNGSIKEIFFEYGQAVAKGQLLLRMDKKEAEMKYRQALATAIREEEEFRKFQDWENNDEVLKAKRYLSRSKMSLDNSKKSYEVTKYLYEKGFVPEMEYESTLQQYETAKIDYEAAKQELTTILERGTGTAYEIARLNMENAKAELTECERRINLAEVVAPVDGTVMVGQNLERDKPGKPIVTGAPVSEGDIMLSVGDTSGFSFRVDVDEIEILKIHPGQEARISGDAFPGIILNGQVANVSTQANVSADLYQRPSFSVLVTVEGIRPEVRDRILLGVTADVVIVVTNKPAAILVPIRAVTEEGPDRFVMLREKKTGDIKKIRVVTGITTTDAVEILNGVSAGDELIVN